MHSYYRKIFYYETDRMGVVHHSNFVRWLEEARVDYMSAWGAPFDEMEAEGVFCPVIGLEIAFKHFARFGDTFRVDLWVERYTGVKLSIGYRVFNQDETLILTAQTSHGFVGKDYRPLSLKKRSPRFHAAFEGNIEREPE